MLSLARAAKQVGKSKPTLLRAIKTGRLSVTRRDDGTYAIDPAELLRVFPLVSEAVPDNLKQTGPHNGVGPGPVILGEVEGLRELLAERDSRIAEKDARIADKDAVIEDLRKRLDAEAEERRKVRAQLTALLTDQRPAPAPAPEPPRSLWGKFLAWRR